MGRVRERCRDDADVLAMERALHWSVNGHFDREATEREHVEQEGLMAQAVSAGCAVVAATVFAWSPGAAFAGDVRFGEGRVLLQWTEHEEAPADVRVALQPRVEALVGQDPVAWRAVRATLVDEGWCPTLTPTDVWKVRVPSVPIRWSQVEGGTVHPGDERRLAIILALDVTDYHLVLAATEPHQRWVIPARRDVEGACPAEVGQWFPQIDGRATPTPQLSVPDVLSLLWGFRLDPGVAGVTIIRPKWAVCRWPPKAHEAGGGPNDQGAVFWFCESHGIVVEPWASDGPQYGSGQLMAIRDDAPVVHICFFVE